MVENGGDTKNIGLSVKQNYFIQIQKNYHSKHQTFFSRIYQSNLAKDNLSL